MLAGAASASADELQLQAVLDRTMIDPPARVAFREVRHNRLLQDDLVITGYLEYPAAGTLRKVIETPFEEAYLVQSDRVEIQRDGVTRTLSLKKSRSLRTMLDGIEAILAGEGEQLASVFDYQLSGAADAWQLQLVPRSRRIARQLTGLTVTGDDESVVSIHFDLRDGEWHRMDIHKNDPPQ